MERRSMILLAKVVLLIKPTEEEPLDSNALAVQAPFQSRLLPWPRRQKEKQFCFVWFLREGRRREKEPCQPWSYFLFFL